MRRVRLARVSRKRVVPMSYSAPIRLRSFSGDRYLFSIITSKPFGGCNLCQLCMEDRDTCRPAPTQTCCGVFIRRRRNISLDFIARRKAGVIDVLAPSDPDQSALPEMYSGAANQCDSASIASVSIPNATPQMTMKMAIGSVAPQGKSSRGNGGLLIFLPWRQAYSAGTKLRSPVGELHKKRFPVNRSPFSPS